MKNKDKQSLVEKLIPLQRTYDYYMRAIFDKINKK